MNHVWPGGERYRTKSCCLNFWQISKKCSSCSRGGANSCRIKALTHLKHVKRHNKRPKSICQLCPYHNSDSLARTLGMRLSMSLTAQPQNQRVWGNSCLCQIQPTTLPGYVKVQPTQSQHRQFWRFGCQSTLISTNEFKSSNKSLISTRH